jgi:hypothetical protein
MPARCRRSKGQDALSRLEFLGPNHGDEQVNEQQQGDNADDQVCHKSALHFFASVGVQPADREENHHHTDINKIHHISSVQVRFRLVHCPTEF